MARTAKWLLVTNDKYETYMNHCDRWLADANEQAEKGNHERAEKYYEKAQYWLDRANRAKWIDREVK